MRQDGNRGYKYWKREDKLFRDGMLICLKNLKEAPGESPGERMVLGQLATHVRKTKH